MEARVDSRRRFRAGLFEIDLGSGELWKSGRKVRLQDQPFLVLAMLLERPGDLVTREQLQARLWPADTYVGFEEGLNTAIRKLRVAFGDSADNPRFIETVPRRGYRFLAPVTEAPRAERLLGQGKEIGDSEEGAGDRPEDSPETAGEAVGRMPAAPAVRTWSWKLVASAAGLLVLILAVGTYLARSRRAVNPAPTKRTMLAILPFQNLSNDTSQEYLSDGLTEETITDLGQLSPEQLGVIARTSAMAYKHTEKTVSQIGRELGVDYILEGSVRREGERIRVSAQLIRVSDQTHLWAQNFDRELNNVLGIEGELGKTIAQQVQLNLTPERQIALSKMRTVDPEAYDLYLKGRYYWNQRTPAGIKESIGYFRQATARDPNFALAYSGLADAYNISNIVGAYSAMESLPQARAAAEKAIELDPSLAEAHAALGMEKSHYDFDFPGAEREFLKAIALNPNSSYAHLFYSNCYLLPMGRTAEAIAENQKALELDPLSLPINNFLGEAYYLEGDYESSYRQFQYTIEMDPTFPLAHDYFSYLLTSMGRYEQAIQERQKSKLLSGSNPEEAAAEAAAALQAFRSGGPRGYWQWNLEVVLQGLKRRDGSASPSGVSMSYALAGDKDSAFQWLEKAYDDREGQAITLVKIDPAWQNLHGDPRFNSFVRRIGLPE